MTVASWTPLQLRRLADCWDHVRVPMNAEERHHRSGVVPYWGANNIQGYVDEALVDEEVVLLGEDGAPFFDRDRPVAFHISHPIWPNNHIHVLKPRSHVNGRWLMYALNDVDYSLYVDGSTRDKLTQGGLMRISLVVPPSTQQRAIADYLDRETAKIDTLIEEQQRLIEKLRERRRSVLHSVTTGRSAAASTPRRDSNVGWIGSIPTHWRTSQIKWQSPVRRGASPRPIDDPLYFDDHGEWSWVRISDVTAATSGRLRSTTQRMSALGSSLSVKLEPSSLFVSIAGTVGKPCITEIRACIHDGFVYFPDLPFPAEWLFRIFEAGECYRGLGKLGTQLNLNTDTVGSITIPLPPRPEMDRILEYLDEQTAKIDTLIAETEHFIELSRERRAALITAAVTGQVDVHGSP